MLLQEGKSVVCLEDLTKFSVKELKGMLKAYKEKTSCVKADLVLRAYAVFCRTKDHNTRDKDCDISSFSIQEDYS